MQRWTLIGVMATAVIALALPIYAINEPSRLTQAQQTLVAEATEQGEIIYAENCALCHGAAGEGIGTYPGLANEGVQTMDYEAIFKVIDRGRDNTAMAAWGVEEGGVLNNWEIDQVITMIQQGDWTSTAQTVEALDLTPPTVLTAEISAETLAQLTNLPNGELIARALPVYAANCAGCHGAQGEGSSIAPVVNSDTLRQQNDDQQLERIIAKGVPGTLMAGWDKTLSESELTDLVGLIRHWDDIPAGAIPQQAAPAIASTDAEVIANGERLYGIVCASCHGVNGQGRPMAPALNTQTFLQNTNDQAIKAIITQGIPETRMPAWGGRLTDEELNALVSYLRSWEGSAPAVAEPTMPGMMGGRRPMWMNNQNQDQGGSFWDWFR